MVAAVKTKRPSRILDSLISGGALIRSFHFTDDKTTFGQTSLNPARGPDFNGCPFTGNSAQYLLDRKSVV